MAAQLRAEAGTLLQEDEAAAARTSQLSAAGISTCEEYVEVILGIFRSVRGLSLEGLVLLLRATCYSLVQRCSHLGQDDSKAFIMIVV